MYLCSARIPSESCRLGDSLFFQQQQQQQQQQVTSPRITLRQYRRARASKIKNRRARAKLKTTHMLRNSKRISQGRTLRPKPGSVAWDIVQGLAPDVVQALVRRLLCRSLPFALIYRCPSFLLTLSGHNSPPDVAREEHPWRLPRIAVMPRRHGDTRFDGMIRAALGPAPPLQKLAFRPS